MYVATGFGDTHQFVPRTLRRIFDCSPMEPSFGYYWWRAIATAYLLRPNTPTLNVLSNLGTLPLHDSSNGSFSTCVAVYVRRGDKHVEMKFVPTDAYMSAAAIVRKRSQRLRQEKLKEKEKEIGRHSHFFNKSMFIASEAQDVIREAEIWGHSNGWKILYTSLFDRTKLTAALDYKTAEKLRRGGGAKHHDLEYLSMLLTLQYAVRCQAWVCTLASNFCRIIDELRATVGGKSNFPFADLSRESCSSPPCIGENIFDFGWRK